MKHVFTLLACVAIFLLSSCGKVYVIDESGQKVEKATFSITPTSSSNLSVYGGSITIHVKSNTSWYCYVNGTGFTGGSLSKTEGKGNAGVTYSFNAIPNWSYSFRYKEQAAITFIWTDENNQTHTSVCSLARG